MENMKNTKYFYFVSLTFAMVFAFTQTTFAMHIMEGMLSPLWCISWGVLCVPFVLVGVKKISKLSKEEGNVAVMLAMAGAFVFVLSSLKIPSVTGSSSHMTGVGFAAIMFGPAVTSILSLIVLLFQAMLLAHGGLSTLGANLFSMGVVGPLVTFGLYVVLKKLKVNIKIVIFIAAMAGDLATYIVTSFQLSAAFATDIATFTNYLTRFLTIFAVTQLPLAIVEGILTVIVINVVSTYGKSVFASLNVKELSFNE